MLVGRISVGGNCVRVGGGGGSVKNTLQGGGTEKRGGETSILKRRCNLGQGEGA